MAQTQLSLPGEQVKMSNTLARARLKGLPLYGGRMIAAFASLVKDTDAAFQEYSIPASSIFPIDAAKMSKKQRDLIEAAADAVLTTIVEVPCPGDPNGFKKYSFSQVVFEHGTLTTAFAPQLKPFFLELKEKFTLFPLGEYLTLTSVYAQKIYLLLRSWRSVPSFSITIEELAASTDTPATYRYQDIRRRIIEPAMREIKKKTTLRVTWETVKEGRKVTAILFRFKNRDQQQPTLPTPPPTPPEKPIPAPGPLPIVFQPLPGDPAPSPRPPVARRRPAPAPLSDAELADRRAMLQAQAAAIRAERGREVAS